MTGQYTRRPDSPIPDGVTRFDRRRDDFRIVGEHRDLLAGIEGEDLLTDRQVSVIENLGHDVEAVIDLVADQIGNVINDLVHGWQLAALCPDVGKPIVVIDRSDVKWLGPRLERI